MFHNFHKSGVQITNQVFVRLRCQRSEIIVRESKPKFFLDLTLKQIVAEFVIKRAMKKSQMIKGYGK